MSDKRDVKEATVEQEAPLDVSTPGAVPSGAPSEKEGEKGKGDNNIDMQSIVSEVADTVTTRILEAIKTVLPPPPEREDPQEAYLRGRNEAIAERWQQIEEDRAKTSPVLRRRESVWD